MKALLDLLRSNDIPVLGGLSLEAFEDQGDRVSVRTPAFEFRTRHLLLATNGFATLTTLNPLNGNYGFPSGPAKQRSQQEE